MKTLLKLGEMLQYLPDKVKDAIHHVAKDSGQKTDDLELHRHSHSEKAAVNGLDPKSRRALKYVSYRTQDRDDEIVIPETINLTEFKKYGHVLVNHNYSLLPVGSDVDISADDYGIKALTEYADTGAGTLANVVWALVSQGHLKSSSIGFVPTSYTKPGSRDWDHVANQLQRNWKEFDKSRAEKSISRIITGGVLLEHSDVSVPCNADAELISVCKAMNLDGKVVKQLGWEMKDGILVNKAEAEPEKCVCDECGYVETVVPGSKCPECKTGDMKPKSKEKAITVISKGGPGSGSWEGPGNPRFAKDDEKYNDGAQRARDSNFGVGDKVKITGKVTGQGKTGVAVGFDKDGSFAKIRIGDKVHSYHNSDVSAVGDEEEDDEKSFHSHAVEKPNPHMPGGSFSACVLIMEDKGHDTESAKKICGAFQAESGEKIYDVIAKEVVNKGGPGSGNFGHEGRPGEVGGSGPGGGGTGDKGAARFETMVSFLKENGIKPYTARDNALRGLSKIGMGSSGGHGPDYEDIVGYAEDCGLSPKTLERDWNKFLEYEKGKSSKSFSSEIKVIRPAPSVKILFAPPTGDMIAAQVGEAVERALSRRTGKIL